MSFRDSIARSPHLPQEHEKFKKTVEQIEQQTIKLEETIKRLKPTTNEEEGVKATLGQIESLLNQYQQEFEEVQRRTTSEGVSAQDVAKLRSLRQATTPGYTRITFYYQLLKRNGGSSEVPARAHGDLRIEVQSADGPSGSETVQSQEEWIKQQAEDEAPPPYGITGFFSSTLGDLFEFQKPVQLILPQRGYKPLKLSKLKVLIRDEKWRTILWLDDDESVMLEHRLKRGTVPWTDPNYKKFEVSFPVEERHIFTRTDVHGIHQDPNVACPKYEFGNEEEMDQFQACIRERQLLGTYVATSVSTDSRIRTTGQFVKIWQTEDDDRRLTFSFWVTEETEVGHLEFDVASFASISGQSDKKSVRFKVKEGTSKTMGFEYLIIRFKYESERAPFLDKLKPDLSLNFGSRKNSATTTVNSSPIILQQEFVPFDWNLLQSRFPGGVDKDNWKDLRDHLPEDIRFNFKFNPPIEGSDASPTWTFHPSGLSTKTSIPLQLKGYSVIIPAPTSPRVVTGSIPPADPRAEELIDPSLELDDDTVNTIFEIYSFAIGFYLFLDGNLQILVPLGFDSATAHSRNPNYFGGLKVGYVEMNLTQTSGNNTKKGFSFTSIFRKDQNPSNRNNGPSSSTLATAGGSTLGLTPRPSSNTSIFTSFGSSTNSPSQPPALKTHDEIEAKVRDLPVLWKLDKNAAATHPYLGKIALRVQRGGVQYLTLSTHVLNNAFMMKPIFGKSQRSGGSVEDLKDKLSILFGRQRIGRVYEVFDDDPANYPKGYRGDISLIQPFEGVDIQNVKAPGTRWIKDEEWKALHTGRVQIEVLGNDGTIVPARPIRNEGERTGRVIGMGYFKNQKPIKASQGIDQAAADYIGLFSNCLLYRLPGDWRDHIGYSGIAVVAKLPQADGERIVAGFQSFAHRTDMPQDNWDEQTFEKRLREGFVCFYGAFKIPKEIREYEICG